MSFLPANLQPLLEHVPVYVLTAFRVAGLMLYSPLFGSSRIPSRAKVMLVLVMTVGLLQLPMPEAQLPETLGGLVLAIGGEMLFGVAMGLVASLVFIAAQWAGEMIGQQLGFNLSEVFDPQFSGGGSIIGDLYFVLTIVVFLIVGGHREMVLGVADSIQRVPPGTMLMNVGLFEMVIDMLMSVMLVAMRIAAPVFVTMLIVDVAMGCIGRTMPQLNVMSAGLSIRAVVGMLVLALGMMIGTTVLHDAVVEALTAYRVLHGF
jgi:flagellar biosynthetic protein FliR